MKDVLVPYLREFERYVDKEVTSRSSLVQDLDNAEKRKEDFRCIMDYCDDLATRAMNVEID
jgi:hypothetical protein